MLVIKMRVNVILNKCMTPTLTDDIDNRRDNIAYVIMTAHITNVMTVVNTIDILIMIIYT